MGDTGVAYDMRVTTQSEYLCNPFAEDLLDVAFSTGGFFSEDALGVVEVNGTHGHADAVAAGAGVRVCVRYRTASGLVIADSFSVEKWLRDAKEFDELPVIGGAGYVIPRCSN